MVLNSVSAVASGRFIGGQAENKEMSVGVGGAGEIQYPHLSFGHQRPELSVPLQNGLYWITSLLLNYRPSGAAIALCFPRSPPFSPNL